MEQCILETGSDGAVYPGNRKWWSNVSWKQEVMEQCILEIGSDESMYPGNRKWWSNVSWKQEVMNQCILEIGSDESMYPGNRKWWSKNKSVFFWKKIGSLLMDGFTEDFHFGWRTHSFSVNYCLIFTVFFVNFEILMNLAFYRLPLKFRKVMFSVLYAFLSVILSVNGGGPRRSLFLGPSIKVPAPFCTGIPPWTCSNLFILNVTVVQPTPFLDTFKLVFTM